MHYAKAVENLNLMKYYFKCHHFYILLGNISLITQKNCLEEVLKVVQKVRFLNERSLLFNVA